jgi:hypothetical protein
VSPVRRVTALALWAAVLYCVAPAWAQENDLPWTSQQCQAFGAFAGVIADFRDAGADVKRHLDVLRRRHAQIAAPLRRVLERELLRVYAEALPAVKAEIAAYTRCMSGQHTAKES